MKPKNKVTILSDQPILIALEKTGRSFAEGVKYFAEHLQRTPEVKDPDLINYEGYIIDKETFIRDILPEINKYNPKDNETITIGSIERHLKAIEKLFEELTTEHYFILRLRNTKSVADVDNNGVAIIGFTKKIGA